MLLEFPLNKDLIKLNVGCVHRQEQISMGGRPSWGCVLMQTETRINARSQGCRFWLLQQHESVGLCVCVLVCVCQTRNGQCDELPVICGGRSREVGFEGTMAGNLRADSFLPMESYTCEDYSCSLMSRVRLWPEKDRKFPGAWL